ncbi:helix-hairpin-helix domain-containing protein [Flavicella sediminum]|uniref:helix-hairpin-helix domain-containing protein n=1 Tax=Flavicella sediminum TaxID=2585141 RepID=UPI00111FA28D|nr:helix-hairpin-helix domain-containing protein [Flavicella sediminum]
MNSFKSHFRYNKRQRNGIFFLLVLLLILQGVYLFVDFSGEEKKVVPDDFIKLQMQLDSLAELKNKAKKVFLLNPNYMTDESGYALGLNLDEIDRLLEFRKTGNKIYDIEDFRNVTGVSDSLAAVLKEKLKYPKRKEIKRKLKVKVISKDLNKASIEDFKSVKGVGNVLGERIVKYRSRLKGFTYGNQLQEVWGLKPEVVEQILKKFSIQSKPSIKKININTASFKEVLATPYLDYKTTKLLFNYKNSVAKIQDVKELKKIEGFPVEKYDRIVLYLQAE